MRARAGYSGGLEGWTDVVEGLRNDLPFAVNAGKQKEVDEVLIPEAGLSELHRGGVTGDVDGQDARVVLADGLLRDRCVQ